MAGLDELSRVIGSLEQAVKENSAQNERLCEKIVTLEKSIEQLTAKVSELPPTVARVEVLEEGMGSLKKLRDRAYLILGLCAISGGAVGGQAGSVAIKLIREVIK